MLNFKNSFNKYVGSSIVDDAIEFLNIIKKYDAKIAIVDHYYLDFKWECIVNQSLQKLIAIDDLANRKHNVDILIDTNINRIQDDYKKYLLKPCKLYLGLDYFILSNEFYNEKMKNKQKTIKSNFKNILVSFGGIDSKNLTNLTLKAISKCHFAKDLFVTVVIGSNFMWKSQLNNLLSSLNYKVKIIEETKKLAGFMNKSDLMIGAGGATSIEALFLELPSILIVSADNQKRNVSNLNKLGVVVKIDSTEELKMRIECLRDNNKRIELMNSNIKKLKIGTHTKIARLINDIVKI